VQRSFGGSIDILVNNAGHMIRRQSNLEMTEELYDQVMDLNMKSTVFACKAVISGMIAKGGGNIVNMTSVAAHNGGGFGSTVYAASKAAVLAYTKGLAKEVADKGIRVNNVSPGFIGETKFHSTLTSEEGRQAAIKSTALGRAGRPEMLQAPCYFSFPISQTI
jgi:3-oxoacyl-[acyl-carrier protein] reductase